jgi:hypothetical protein
MRSEEQSRLFSHKKSLKVVKIGTRHQAMPFKFMFH